MGIKASEEGWSKSRLASEFGVDRRTIDKCMAGVRTYGSHVGHPIWKLRDAAIPIVKYILGLNPEQSLDPDTLAPDVRKDWYDSEIKRLKYEEEIGKLVKASDIAEADAEKNKKIALALDTMADVLERDVKLNPEQVLAMNRIIDGLRNELYTSLTGIEVDE